MGSSSSKEKASSSKASSIRTVGGQSSSGPQPAQQSQGERTPGLIYSHRLPRGSRPELPFLGIVRNQPDATPAGPERPRETKQEREARKVEKERQARTKERERSLREEHVDAGYLVTLGVYTGPEDFSKTIVRQLQIERRLAPFWRGLNDHSDSWTEAQLVAAARGLPIPAADEIPPELSRTTSQTSIQRASDVNVNSLMVPITSRSLSHDSSTSASPSASHPALSSSGPASPTSPTASTAQLFRGRAKTLATLATGSKLSSPDLTPQEIRLPRDPNVNGQPVEAYLYKDASECPICFMYYPPYLNKTRCCDQPICSECFVQIKRPDPHPPEHDQPGRQRSPEEESETLVSEVACCPFCVTPEFGVSYEPPPFRRGLAYANQNNPLKYPTSATSSTSSLNAGMRRRATSLSANAPQVITTDRVRPDWAKKLADARAHALRRSAAATALHNAAYVLGAQGDGQLRGSLAGFSRRRRTLFADSPGGSGIGTPQEGGSDLFPARGSSHRSRVDDLEELMMMEAIRLSLAAEEDRKKKEDKEAKKDAKKKAKEEKKEAKQAEKQAKKDGSSLYRTGTNDSSSTWATTSMARSSSNLGIQASIPKEQMQGKGKQPVQDFAGFNPLLEPTSSLNTEMRASSLPPASAFLSSSISDDAQRHLEESRANLQPTTGTPIPGPGRAIQHVRQFSNVSSVASSFNESSVLADSNNPSATVSGLDLSTASHMQDRSGTPPTNASIHEPMLNFRSLAAMIGEEEKLGQGSDHIEKAERPSAVEEQLKEPSPTGSPRLGPMNGVEGNRSRGDSGESSSSMPPPIYVEHPPNEGDDADQITPAPRPAGLVHGVDRKDIRSIDVLDRGHSHEVT